MTNIILICSRGEIAARLITILGEIIQTIWYSGYIIKISPQPQAKFILKVFLLKSKIPLENNRCHGGSYITHIALLIFLLLRGNERDMELG